MKPFPFYHALNALIGMGFEISIRRINEGDVELVVGNYYGRRPLIIRDTAAHHAIGQLNLICAEFLALDPESYQCAPPSPSRPYSLSSSPYDNEDQDIDHDAGY